MNYVTNQSTRVIIKAAGDLSPSPTHILDAVESERRYGDEVLDNGTEPINEHIEAPESPVDVNTYRPTIRADKVWVLSEIDLGEHSPIIHRFLSNAMHKQSGLGRDVIYLGLVAVVLRTRRF